MFIDEPNLNRCGSIPYLENFCLLSGYMSNMKAVEEEQEKIVDNPRPDLTNRK